MIQECRDNESQIIKKSKPDEGLFVGVDVGCAQIFLSHQKKEQYMQVVQIFQLIYKHFLMSLLVVDVLAACRYVCPYSILINGLFLFL